MFSIYSRMSCPKGVFVAVSTLLALAGCHASGGGAAAGSLQWFLYDVDDRSMTSPIQCETAGAGQVVVSMTDRTTGRTYNDSFDCATYVGTSEYVPVGTYDVTASLYGAPSIYLNSQPLLSSITETAIPLLRGISDLGVADFMVNSFDLSWMITKSNVPTTCQFAGARYVSLDVRFMSNSFSKDLTFPLICDRETAQPDGTYYAATVGIPTGSYSVQWQARLTDANDREVAVGLGTQNFRVEQGARASLGQIEFRL